MKKCEKEIMRLKTDNLTGVGNRFKLDDYLEEINKNKIYNVILIDVNNLHNINRTKGYNCGDKYLLDIVNKIKKELINTSAQFFRIGGDEFLIFYYPYDKVDLSKIKNITFVENQWKPKILTFRELMEILDSKLIKEKRKNKPFWKRLINSICKCR